LSEKDKVSKPLSFQGRRSDKYIRRIYIKSAEKHQSLVLILSIFKIRILSKKYEKGLDNSQAYTYQVFTISR